jgi:hypothetical protein
MFVMEFNTYKCSFVIFIALNLLIILSFDLSAQPLVDVAIEAGLPELQRYRGNAVVLDIDGDLDQDIALSSMTAVSLYRNDSTPGTPLFVDVTEESGFDALDDMIQGFGVGDFDGDGDEDIYLTAQTLDVMMMNNGDGTFQDERSFRLPGISATSRSVAIADFDIDGDLDIYVVRSISLTDPPFSHGEYNTLLVNDGSGHFVDGTIAAGLDVLANSWAAAWTDIDQDGWLDLIVANDYGPLSVPLQAFRNEGTSLLGEFAFEDMSATWGFDRGLHGMGIGVQDLNWDGILDYFITSIGRHGLLLGSDDATVVDGADLLNMTSTFTPLAYHVGWSTASVDITGDGYSELYLRSGDISTADPMVTDEINSDVLWSIGGPDLETENVASTWLPDLDGTGRSVFLADVDSDDRADIIGTSFENPFLLMMGASSDRVVQLELISTVSAPGAPGTVVTASCEEDNLIYLSQGGGLPGSYAPTGRMWVGLPMSCIIPLELSIHWPSGVVSRETVLPGRTVVLEEPFWLDVEIPSEGVEPDSFITVRLTPLDEEGEFMGSGLLIEGAISVREPVIATDLGDGNYEMNIPTGEEAGVYSLNFWVEGLLLRTHPKVSISELIRGELTTYPQNLVVGSEVLITIEGKEVGNYEILVDGLELPLNTVGEAVFQATVVVPDKPQMTFQLLYNGAMDGSLITKPVFQAVVEFPAMVRASDPYLYDGVAPSEDMVIDIHLRDINRLPSVVDITLNKNGEPYDEFNVRPWNNALYLTIIDRETIAEGDSFQFMLEGEPIGTPIEIINLTDSEATSEEIDPVMSRYGTFFEGCYGDGQDLLYVVLKLRNNEDWGLIDVPDVALEAEGAEVILGPVISNETIRFTLRCGEVAGLGTFDVLIGESYTGLSRSFPIYPAIESLWLVEESSLLFEEETVPGELGAFVSITPRDIYGNIVGSGAGLTLVANEEVEIDQPVYEGVGFFEGRVYGPRNGGLVSVQIWAHGVDTGWEFELNFFPWSTLTDEGTVTELELDGGPFSDWGIDRSLEPVLEDGISDLSPGEPAPDLTEDRRPEGEVFDLYADQRDEGGELPTDPPVIEPPQVEGCQCRLQRGPSSGPQSALIYIILFLFCYHGRTIRRTRR